MMRTSKLAISHLRHDLEDVAILDRVVPADHHFRPGVDGADEVVTQVGVDFKGYVHRGGSARHQERVREDVPALVGPVVLVLHGVHDDQVEQLVDGLLDALLHPGRPALSQKARIFSRPFSWAAVSFSGCRISNEEPPGWYVTSPADAARRRASSYSADVGTTG